MPSPSTHQERFATPLKIIPRSATSVEVAQLGEGPADPTSLARGLHDLAAVFSTPHLREKGPSAVVNLSGINHLSSELVGALLTLQKSCPGGVHLTGLEAHAQREIQRLKIGHLFLTDAPAVGEGKDFPLKALKDGLAAHWHKAEIRRESAEREPRPVPSATDVVSVELRGQKAIATPLLRSFPVSNGNEDANSVFKNAVAKLIGSPHLEIDLRHVEHLSESFIGVMLDIAKRQREADGEFSLVGTEHLKSSHKFGILTKSLAASTRKAA